MEKSISTENYNVPGDGLSDAWKSRLVHLVEQVEKKQRFLRISFLSIKRPFDRFFESKNHDEDDAEPSNYNRPSVGSQEVHFYTPFCDDNLRVEKESPAFKAKKNNYPERNLSQ